MTWCFPLILESLRATLGPIELFAAHGHGRSYGMSSRVLWRVLPGIRQCGIWAALEDRPARGDAPLALVTDIGNDLLYGAIPDQILRWVDLCIDRLEEQGAHIVATALPMESLAKLGRTRYAFLKAILFPGKGPTWQHMQELARSLDSGLAELAKRRQFCLIRPSGDWYGFDPIHIRRSRQTAAISRIFSGWPGIDGHVLVRRPAHGTAIRTWRLRPAERTMFGKGRLTPQPVATLDDGSLVSLY